MANRESSYGFLPWSLDAAMVSVVFVGNGWLDFIASICASCMVFLYSMHAAKDTWILKNVLRFFGENSLVILSAHLVEMNVLPLPKLSDLLCAGRIRAGTDAFFSPWALFSYVILPATGVK